MKRIWITTFLFLVMYALYARPVLRMDDGLYTRIAYTSHDNRLTDGMNDAVVVEMNVWPVPSLESVNIRLKGEMAPVVKIEVVNLLGQTLKETIIRASGDELNTSIGLADMPKGVVFIKVSNGTVVRGFRVLNQ